MSDILQKTLASLPGVIGASFGGSRSDGTITVGIQTFVQNIIALRSKHVSLNIRITVTGHNLRIVIFSVSDRRK